MHDIYVDEKTGVLINKLGITDAEKLRQAESDITIVRLKEILQNAGAKRVINNINEIKIVLESITDENSQIRA